MPRSSDPDPLGPMRRRLAEEERRVAAQRARLEEELLRSSMPPPPPEPKAPEPPVWRLEDDFAPRRAADPSPPRKRNLARQRFRDMMLAFVFIAVLLVVLVIALWVAYVRNTGLANGS